MDGRSAPGSWASAAGSHRKSRSLRESSWEKPFQPARAAAHRVPARAIAYGWQLAPVTSPLVGEVGSRAIRNRRLSISAFILAKSETSDLARASREGGIRSAESNKHPPPHPSPTRGEGAECGLLRAICGSPGVSARNEAARKRRSSFARRPITGPPQSSQPGVIVPYRRGRRGRRQHPPG